MAGHRICAALGVLLMGVAASGHSEPAALAEEASVGTPAPAARPQLQVHSGQYYRYAMPRDWRATENASALEMAAPDGVTGAAFSLLLGAFGQATPQGHLTSVLQSGVYQNPQVDRVRELPDQPGIMGLAWKLIEAELRFEYRGVPCRAHATVGVLQGAGQYAAFIRAYQAPAERFASARYWLPAIAETVQIHNAQAIAGQARMVLPKGTSHGYIYDDYNAAWEQRGQSQGRIARAQHEGTMGYERMRDARTGELFDMPLEAYDPTEGGYRHPREPDVMLERAPDGW